MSEPFLAEIKMVGFNFAPRGWATCDGQILPIAQNQSLYSLLGTTYGGDGRTSFALPGLRGRTPIHVGDSGFGTSHQLGSKGGEEGHQLTIAQIPQHGHYQVATSAAADQSTPGDNILAATTDNIYGDKPTAPITLNANALANTGNGQAHNNMQPYLTINFCIALQGLFPSRN